jgi:hypothetical protein
MASTKPIRDEGIAGERKIITMTVRQRLNVEGLIRQERPDELEGVYLLRDMMNKIRIPEEERGQYVAEVLGQVRLDDKAINAATGTIDVSFNMPEARKLKTLVRKWKPNVDDLVWYEPLLEALQDVK